MHLWTVNIIRHSEADHNCLVQTGGEGGCLILMHASNYTSGPSHEKWPQLYGAFCTEVMDTYSVKRKRVTLVLESLLQDSLHVHSHHDLYSWIGVQLHFFRTLNESESSAKYQLALANKEEISLLAFKTQLLMLWLHKPVCGGTD